MLVSILNILLDLAALGVLLATAAFVLQSGSAIFVRDRPFPASPSRSYRPSVAVLVPLAVTENPDPPVEEQHIEATLHRIKNDLSTSDHLLVVADNCVDQTASLATRGGAEVVVRNDSSRCGK